MKIYFKRRWIVAASIAILLVFVALALAGDKKVGKACTFKDIPLYGKVKFVSSGGDIKIQVTCSFPDLKVKMVTSFPDKCGEWQIVDSFPDFTVQFVESFPDIKIQFVDSFPGLP